MTATTTTAPALAVRKDGQDFVVTNEAGDVLARATTRKEAREAKAQIEAEALAPTEEVPPLTADEVGDILTEAQVLTEIEAIVDANEEEWVPAADDTTETGEAPAVDVVITGSTENPVVTEVKSEPKAKKVNCSGSSTYVGYWDEDVTEFTKKGRAAWVSTNCPGCNTKVRAGVWFTEKGEALNGERGLAYLPKH